MREKSSDSRKVGLKVGDILGKAITLNYKLILYLIIFQALLRISLLGCNIF